MKHSLGACLFAFGILFGSTLNAQESSADSSLSDISDVTVASDAFDEKRWSSFLPLWQGLTKDISIDLPLPIGISAAYVTAETPMKVLDAELFVDGGLFGSIDGEFVTSADARATNFSIMVDVFVLPFLNLSASYGPTKGSVPVAVKIPESEILVDFDPESAGDNVLLEEELEYSGSTTSFGGLLVGGIPMESGSIFAAADVKFTYTSLDILSDTIKAQLYSYRLGWDSYFNSNRYQVFAGTMKQNASQTSTVPISGLNLPLLRDISAKISFEDPVGYTPFIGGGYEISPNWTVVFENRFGSRKMISSVLNYRF